MTNTLRRIRVLGGDLASALAGSVTLGWLLIDHVRRRLTGRPALFDELFSDLRIEITEDDIRKPYEAPERKGEE